RNPGKTAGVCVSLRISHIYRGLQVISFHQHQKSLSFGYLCLSETEMVFDEGLYAGAFHRDFNISQLAVAYDEERILFIKFSDRVRDPVINDTRMISQIVVFIAKADIQDSCLFFFGIVREERPADLGHCLSEKTAQDT